MCWNASCFGHFNQQCFGIDSLKEIHGWLVKKNSRRSFSPLQHQTMFKSYLVAAQRFIGRFRSCLWNNQTFYCLIKSRESRRKLQKLSIIWISNLEFHNIKAIDYTLTTLGPILSSPVNHKDMKCAHKIVFLSWKFLPYQFYLSLPLQICSLTSAIFFQALKCFNFSLLVDFCDWVAGWGKTIIIFFLFQFFNMVLELYNI